MRIPLSLQKNGFSYLISLFIFWASISSKFLLPSLYVIKLFSSDLCEDDQTYPIQRILMADNTIFKLDTNYISSWYECESNTVFYKWKYSEQLFINRYEGLQGNFE